MELSKKDSRLIIGCLVIILIILIAILILSYFFGYRPAVNTEREIYAGINVIQGELDVIKPGFDELTATIRHACTHFPIDYLNVCKCISASSPYIPPS